MGGRAGKTQPLRKLKKAKYTVNREDITKITGFCLINCKLFCIAFCNNDALFVGFSLICSESLGSL